MSEYTQRDYEAIEAAVMESPRGRWFLAEFARRNRAADTLKLFEAIRRLEHTVAGISPHRASDERAPEPSDTVAADGSGALTAENLSYFEGDEDLFEAAPETAEDACSPDPAPSLVVVGEEQGRTRPAQREAGRADPGPAPLTSGPKGNPKDRVVFIRRASSKETSIPLVDEADDPFSSARSQPGS